LKIKCHRFVNGHHEIFLPRSASSRQLADVTFEVIKKLAPDGKKKLKYITHKDDEIEVESAHHFGFFMNGHQYVFGEIYKRLK